MKSQQYNPARRNFLKNSVLTGALFPLLHAESFAITTSNIAAPLKIHIFSKHLQFLNYRDMADAVAELGFDGIDLTVRPKGHVLPEKVEEDLPKAIDAIRKVGLASSMMVTAVDDARDPVDKKVLAVAAKLGIRYYRMNWFSYPEGESMPAGIQTLQQKVKEISQVNKELGLMGCYQNHAGTLVGASLWELWQLLKEADKQHMGIQYDIRHAVVEGGTSWQNGLRLIQPHIKTLAIKDFNWEKKNGVWDIHDTPIGEGMVDFKTYFKLLKQYQINVPVSLHLEYPLGGAENGATQISCDKQVVFKAMKRDLQRVHELWQQA
jgi:sugar phosphate isomerase/epimerase